MSRWLWPRVARPLLAVSRYCSSQPDSSLISRRNPYSKQEPEARAKTIAKPGDPLWATVTQKDLLYETMQQTTTLEKLFKLVGRHHSNFRQKHVKLAFDKLEVLPKSSEDTRAAITESPEFALLCSAAIKMMRTFNGEELLAIFRRLIELRIPADTLIVRSTLQMIRWQLNDLYIENLLFLEHLLDHEITNEHPVNGDSTIAALRVALPLVLEVRLKNDEFDHEDPSVLLPCLRVAVSRSLSTDVINKLVSLIKHQEDNRKSSPCQSRP